ncbi:hypothetical protein [Spirosoma endophyticum]|uniref:Lipocalin-like domain-containing protein n=1 Tax=Spirosoma endophyticum TaxID=662367 RepID=A0A1I1UGN3_9BACT|nr:hypothetical protein [Spirosoma endophyticum]SFD67923.1 hypothetical protein SAMN05216167_106196 [Spirosoma endophyticum]
MKNLFISLSLATLSLFAVASCKTKSDPTPATTTDAYVGEYSVTGNDAFTANGKTANNNLTANLTVMQSPTPGRYFFFEKYGTVEYGYFVTVVGSDFESERIVDQTFPDGNRWIGYRTTKGKFNGNEIVYQSETPAFNIANFGLGSYPTSFSSLSRKVTYRATRK